MSASVQSRAERAHLDLRRVTCLGDALRDAMVPFKSNLALIECEREREIRRLTYAELRHAAERRAALLQAHGLAPGERVAIIMTNQADWIISALAALWSGAVLVPLDVKLSPRELAGLLAHARPRVVLSELPVWQRLRRDAAEALGEPLVLVCGAAAGEALDGALSAEAEPDGAFTYVARQRQDPACIVYSSGTGGEAKGCTLSHHAYLMQVERLGNLFPVRETDRYLSILPTNHAIDFACGFLLPVLFGGCVIHPRSLRPQFVSWAMQRYRPTHAALVPMILREMADRIRESLADLPGWQRSLVELLTAANAELTTRRPRPEISTRLLRPLQRRFGGRLRLVVCGGAAVDRRDAELFQRIGIPLAIGYGLTEACAVVSVNDLEPFRADTVGKPLPGIRVEVRAPDADGIGEVWIRGDTVMDGYLDAPELTAETLVDGWLRTGDLGRLDAAGHLILVGRSANLVVTAGGKNVYPEDVEAAFGPLRDCEEYCVMAANFVWPERSLTNEQLVVILRAAGEPSAELLADLRDGNLGLAVHQKVSGYLPWGSAFPRTASLKVKRGELAEQVRQRTGREALVSLNGAREGRDD